MINNFFSNKLSLKSLGLVLILGFLSTAGMCSKSSSNSDSSNSDSSEDSGVYSLDASGEILIHGTPIAVGTSKGSEYNDLSSDKVPYWYDDHSDLVYTFKHDGTYYVAAFLNKKIQIKEGPLNYVITIHSALPNGVYPNTDLYAEVSLKDASGAETTKLKWWKAGSSHGWDDNGIEQSRPQKYGGELEVLENAADTKIHYWCFSAPGMPLFPYVKGAVPPYYSNPYYSYTDPKTMDTCLAP